MNVTILDLLVAHRVFPHKIVSSVFILLLVRHLQLIVNVAVHKIKNIPLYAKWIGHFCIDESGMEKKLPGKR